MMNVLVMAKDSFSSCILPLLAGVFVAGGAVDVENQEVQAFGDKPKVRHSLTSNSPWPESHKV